MKQRIEHLVNIYCDQVFSTDNEAGWHTPSQLDITQYKSNSGSDLLRRIKFSARHCSADLHQPNDRPDDKAIYETQFIKKKHYDFELAKMLLHKLKDKQLLALIAGRHLQYVYKKEHKEEEVAKYLLMSKASFRHNKRQARAVLASNLNVIDQYKELLIA